MDLTGIMRVNIDFETRSRADIKLGAERMASDESTDALMLAYRPPGDEAKVKHWDIYHEPRIPNDLRLFIECGATFSAYNAKFEWLIFNYVLNIPIPFKSMHCSMIESHSMGFSGSMGAVAEEVGLEVNKCIEGRKLIKQFSINFADPDEHPRDYAKFIHYNIVDVEVEYQLSQRLRELRT